MQVIDSGPIFICSFVAVVVFTLTEMGVSLRILHVVPSGAFMRSLRMRLRKRTGLLYW